MSEKSVGPVDAVVKELKASNKNLEDRKLEEGELEDSKEVTSARRKSSIDQEKGFVDVSSDAEITGADPGAGEGTIKTALTSSGINVASAFSANTSNYNDASNYAGASDSSIKVSFFRILRSEWTKIKSLRSTVYSLLAAFVLTVGLSAVICAASASRYNEFSPVEQALFDPTSASLAGLFLAQLAVGVLGVLSLAGEYSTGMSRSTFSAVPKRLPVLWAKLIVLSLVVFFTMLVACLVGFLLGQALLTGPGIGVSLGDQGVLRAVVGAAFYLTAISIFGIAIGAILKNVPASITALFGSLLVLPIIVALLPSDWSRPIGKYLPSSAGQAMTQVLSAPFTLSPLQGFLLLLVYAGALVLTAAVFLKRKDI